MNRTSLPNVIHAETTPLWIEGRTISPPGGSWWSKESDRIVGYQIALVTETRKPRARWWKRRGTHRTLHVFTATPVNMDPELLGPTPYLVRLIPDDETVEAHIRPLLDRYAAHATEDLARSQPS